MKNLSYKVNGFALPVVLITCLALMIVVLSSMTAASTLRTSIDDQYYDRLANEAAQSGVTYAVACLSQNSYTQTWTSPLTQTKNCDDTPIIPERVIKGQANTRTTFQVADIEGRNDGAVMVTSTGKIDRLVDGSTTVAKTYTRTVKRIANSAYIKFSGVTFGYYFYGDIGNSGVYYYVKGSDGKLRAAGSNDYGQLGNGSSTNVITPTEVNIPDGKKAAAAYTNFLSQGWNAYIITTDGLIYGSGWNNKGQLGTGTVSTTEKNLQKYNLPGGEKAEHIGILGFATYVITDKGNIYATGACTAGELGIGNQCSGDDPVATPTKVVGLPTPTSDPSTHPANEILADYRAAFVRMQDGRVYGWGANSDGQLCNGNRNDVDHAIQIGNFGNSGQPKATQVSFDGISVFILDSTGTVWACGSNYFGQLGVGTTQSNYTSLQKVKIPSSAGKVVQVSTDQWYATFRTASGQVWGSGLNGSGQLGNGNIGANETLPVRFQLPTKVKAVGMYESSIGNNYDGHYNNVLVIGNDGKVYGAGGNIDGQLGNGRNDEFVKTPVVMSVFDGKTKRAKSVVTGLGTTIILSSTNEYYTVGNNQYGQLGNGSTAPSNKPAPAKFLQQASGSFVF